MKNVAANLRYWIAGSVVAIVGVALAREVAPQLAATARLWCTVGGQVLALSGLLIICVGVSRRTRRGNEPT